MATVRLSPARLQGRGRWRWSEAPLRGPRRRCLPEGSQPPRLRCQWRLPSPRSCRPASPAVRCICTMLMLADATCQHSRTKGVRIPASGMKAAHVSAACVSVMTHNICAAACSALTCGSSTGVTDMAGRAAAVLAVSRLLTAIAAAIIASSAAAAPSAFCCAWTACNKRLASTH